MKKLLILMLIISFAGAAQAVWFEDNFDHITTAPGAWDRINYAGWYAQSLGNPYPGGAWNIGGWDGYQSLAPADGIQRTIAAYNHVETFNWGMGEYTASDPLAPNYDPDKVVQLPFEQDGTAGGVYRVVSIDSYWADGMNSGPFLYKNIGTGLDNSGTGDFTAYVDVVGQNYIWNNMGGLMARDPASATENWVYLTYFPNYSVGNHIRTTVNGVSTEMGLGHGFPCDPYLKLSRVGTKFYFKTSPDGITYTSLPGLEAGLDRPDLPAELQVGIFQANYASDWIGPMDFDNFVLIPEPATIALLGLGGLALIRRKR